MKESLVEYRGQVLARNSVPRAAVCRCTESIERALLIVNGDKRIAIVRRRTRKLNEARSKVRRRNDGAPPRAIPGYHNIVS